jgi:hypothetical protein
MEMTPENWYKVKALFDSVFTLEPSERACFLSQNCPDDGLRQEVEKLVSNYLEAGQFPERSRRKSPPCHSASDFWGPQRRRIG